MVSTIVVNEGRELAVDLEITAGRANKARLNRSPVRSAREVLGVLRAVLFAPEDLALVRGDPGERRRYLDELATTRRPRIAAVRADYDKVLRQRTALLKTAAGARFRGDRSVTDTLDVWDGHLAAHGAQLIAARVELVNELAPEVEKAYQLLAPASRPAAIQYRSTVEEIDGQNETVESSRRRCSTLWQDGGPPRSNAESAWSARTATIWNCASVTNSRKALPATGNRGRWRWRCGWRPTNCCGPKAANRCCFSTTCSPNWTPRDDRRWPASRPRRNRCLVTAAVPDDIPGDWDARRIEITMRDDDSGRVSVVGVMTDPEDAGRPDRPAGPSGRTDRHGSGAPNSGGGPRRGAQPG